jgi:hypothetical protein
MASDKTKALMGLALMPLLDGVRPSGREWVSPVSPVVTQVAVGAGHWVSGRPQRALAAWAGAAGSGLTAWGLGTEAPTRAEADKNIRQQRDLLRQLGAKLPAETGTEAHTRQRSWNALSVLGSAAQVVTGVRSGLRHPRRLTDAIVSEAPAAVFYVLRPARAVQRRRPRIAAGSALAAAGSLARLWAASAEPLR